MCVSVCECLCVCLPFLSPFLSVSVLTSLSLFIISSARLWQAIYTGAVAVVALSAVGGGGGADAVGVVFTVIIIITIIIFVVIVKRIQNVPAAQAQCSLDRLLSSVLVYWSFREEQRTLRGKE